MQQTQLTQDQIRKVAEQLSTSGDADKITDLEVALRFFLDDTFRGELSDFIWREVTR